MSQIEHLPAIKIFGHLPLLQINFSDRKYKTVMRVIDLILEQISDSPDVPPKIEEIVKQNLHEFNRITTVDETPVLLYDSDDSDQFFDANDEAKPSPQNPDKISLIVDFKIDRLNANVKKTSKDNAEDELADAHLDDFSVLFTLYPYHLTVEVIMKKLNVFDKMNTDPNFAHIMTSENINEVEDSKELVHINYTRVTLESPEFLTKYDGIAQKVEVQFSTLNVVVTQKSILTIYYFILETFVPEDKVENKENEHKNEQIVKPQTPPTVGDRIVVKVKMQDINLILNNDGSKLATFNLAKIDFNLNMTSSILKLFTKVGTINIYDHSQSDTHHSFRQLLSFEKEETEFGYESFNNQAIDLGCDQSIYAKIGSARMTCLETPILDLMKFLSRFAEMHILFESARQAAIDSAAQLQEHANRIHFDIKIDTPYLVFPRNLKSKDTLIANLGEIKLINKFVKFNDTKYVNEIRLDIEAIRLTSVVFFKDFKQSLQIIDDVNITLNMSYLEHLANSNHPVSSIDIVMSDLFMRLTLSQYSLLLDVFNCVMRIIGIYSTEEEKSLSHETPVIKTESKIEEDEKYPTLDVSFKLNKAELEIFDGDESSQSMKSTKLSELSLNNIDVKYISVNTSESEVEGQIHSLVVMDTRTDYDYTFREVIPATEQEGAQFMAHVEMKPNLPMDVIMTIDSPKIYLAVDFLFKLKDFIFSPFEEQAPPITQTPSKLGSPNNEKKELEQMEVGLHYKVNVVDAELLVLANLKNPNSEAIVLTIKQVILSQKDMLTLTVDQIGMSLCQVNQIHQLAIKFIEKFDIILSMDDRITGPGHRITNIVVDVKPLIFKLSYRDFIIIMDIFNKFYLLVYPENEKKESPITKNSNLSIEDEIDIDIVDQPSDNTFRSYKGKDNKQTFYQLISKEELKVNMEGIEVVLIRDTFDMPIIDINTGKFVVNIKNWSLDLKVDAQFKFNVDYFNLKNSHWEPFIEPWTIGLTYGMSNNNKTTKIELMSNSQLNINITPQVIDLGLNFYEEIQTLNPLDVPRGKHIPYIIRNRTGYEILIWNETDKTNSQGSELKKLKDGDDVQWRFNDWHKMRESIQVTKNKIGIHIEGLSWESLHEILVDKESKKLYTLRPMINDVSHKLECEIELKDQIKIVTFRSPFSFINDSTVDIDLVMVDHKNVHESKIFTVESKKEFYVPLEFAHKSALLIKPTDYDWSTEQLYWRNHLINSPPTSLVCNTEDKKSLPFRFHLVTEINTKEAIKLDYPVMKIILCPPFEFENLLPYDIQLNMIDKKANNKLSAFVKSGSTVPIYFLSNKNAISFNVKIMNPNYNLSETISINDRSEKHYIKTVELNDIGGSKLRLKTKYNAISNRQGAFRISLFSPYIIINKTGLDMFFKSQSITRSNKLAAGQLDPTNDELKPFMFSYGSFEDRKRILIKVDESNWSSPVSLEASGTVAEIKLKSAQKVNDIFIGMIIEEGTEWNFNYSKIVTFTPRYIIKNQLDSPLLFREIGCTKSTTLEEKEKQSIYYIKNSGDHQITFSYPGLNKQWSAPIKMNLIGSLYIRMAKTYMENKVNKVKIELIKVDIMIKNSTLFIIINESGNKWPFYIENRLGHEITFYQYDSKDSTSTNSSGSKDYYGLIQKYCLKAGRMVPYSWDFPCMESKTLVINIDNAYERKIDLSQIGPLVPFKYKIYNKARTMAIDVIAEGSVRKLKLSEYNSNLNSFKPSKKPDASTSKRLSTATSGFEVMDQYSQLISLYHLKLEDVGISVINRRSQELTYFTLRGVDLKLEDTDVNLITSLHIHWIQIDNMLFGGIFPIVLYMSDLPVQEMERKTQPSLQFVSIKAKDESYGVQYYKYWTFLIQELSLEVDEDFLFACLDFSKYTFDSTAPTSDKENSIKRTLTLDIEEPLIIEDELPVFFELLHIQPFKLNLSFVTTERINQEKTASTSSNPLGFMTNFLTMTIGNVNDAPIKLNALILENVLSSYPTLMDKFQNYYTQEFLLQLYKVIGFADVIGNPVGLFNNVVSGVYDLFYEPYQGVVMSDKLQDVGIGVAKGATSLVKKTLYGFSDSLTKMSDSLGKGLSVVTMDKKFQDQRRMNRIKNKPRHAFYGFTQGTNSLASSVASGLSGVITKPMEGMEKEGVAGFFKGVSRGFVGMVTKPAVGVFDFASNIAEGVKNTTTIFENNTLDRIRLTRFIPSDGILILYSQRDALGQMWLFEVKNGKYFQEGYVAHIEIITNSKNAFSSKQSNEKKETGPKRCIMVTKLRLLLIKMSNMELEWDLLFDEILFLSLEQFGISITLQDSVPGPFIPIRDKSSRDWFWLALEAAYLAYMNDKKPID